MLKSLKKIETGMNLFLIFLHSYVPFVAQKLNTTKDNNSLSC